MVVFTEECHDLVPDPPLVFVSLRDVKGWVLHSSEIFGPSCEEEGQKRSFSQPTDPHVHTHSHTYIHTAPPTHTYVLNPPFVCINIGSRPKNKWVIPRWSGSEDPGGVGERFEEVRLRVG